MTGRERRLANASLTAQEHQPTAAVHRLAEQTPQRRQEIPAFDQHINHSTAAPPQDRKGIDLAQVASAPRCIAPSVKTTSAFRSDRPARSGR
jgi:hypothetical protein